MRWVCKYGWLTRGFWINEGSKLSGEDYHHLVVDMSSMLAGTVFLSMRFNNGNLIHSF